MLKFRRRTTSPGAPASARVAPTQGDVVCHCLQVPYDHVRVAIAGGATCTADIQWQAFRHEARVVPPKDDDRTRIPQPMYMPVLAATGATT